MVREGLPEKLPGSQTLMEVREQAVPITVKECSRKKGHEVQRSRGGRLWQTQEACVAGFVRGGVSQRHHGENKSQVSWALPGQGQDVAPQ